MTCVSACERSGPSSSKNFCSVFSPLPSPTHTTRFFRWSTTTRDVLVVAAEGQLVHADDVQLLEPGRDPALACTTRWTMVPTVRQLMPISRQVAVLSMRCASQAVISSNS